MWMPGFAKNFLAKKIAKELEREVGKMPKSWRTTVYGVILILQALATAGAALLDGDPSTVANWNQLSASVLAGFALISARDQRAHKES